MLTRATLILAFVLLATSGPLLSDAPTARPDDILAFLNQSIVWHRQLSAQEQLVREPSDAVFLNDNRQIADQVIRLSFEFARTEAQQLALQAGAANAAGNTTQPPASQYQNLVSMLEKSNQSVSQVQKEIESFKSQIATAAGKKRALLESQLAETESELALLQVRRDAVQNLLEFASGVSSSSAGAGGLHAQIEELARTVPAVAAQPATPAAGNAAPTATSTPVAVATSNDSKDAP